MEHKEQAYIRTDTVTENRGVLGSRVFYALHIMPVPSQSSKEFCLYRIRSKDLKL